MVVRQLIIKPGMPDDVYIKLIEIMKEQRVFMSSGILPDKWIMGVWTSDKALADWLKVMGLEV